MPKIKAFFSFFTQPRQQDQVLLIKGSYYYDADRIDATGQLSINMPLQLCPEPDNEYDANAIQVWVTVPIDQTHLLGYLPRSEAKRINQLLKHQYITACQLETCYRQYQRLYLYVRITTRLTFWQRLQMHWHS
ncbi:HIRAN domain-containing protein [Hydrogenovibrio sp. 3SP14C1]|uniref:HIRAN domain-containing protein n=1 Tax=Hydrogenovibrio sp. 3SP14C1 TaxID=3038774 RepID=UPI0024172E3D|nr:HIRAN domain-containing protein [Hydrogenovibrio sp. 3SP14C1]MDG4812279.1 HIRAN domain-containing protein [Hydrogenovibrio sp. 3SP14C1]